ncbi:MAG: LysE family transporter, partial [Chitinophagaceae bacterium]|nr:LysE family transporter [Rubrivivax sp.]
AFMLWLAWRTWREAAAPGATAAASPVVSDTRRGLLASFAGTFLLTLANPATVLSFVAIFGVLAGRGPAPGSPWVMVAGVLVGSALWWLLLSVVVGALRERFDARARAWVGRTSAGVLAGFALWQWAGLL